MLVILIFTEKEFSLLFFKSMMEVFAAQEIESQYTKEEIFELYANTVYFGDGCYGIR